MTNFLINLTELTIWITLKVKDKYGDVDEDEESSETEDEDAREMTEEVEKEFFKALSLVKSRDPKIYDKEKCRFFEIEKKDDTSDSSPVNSKTKEKKSFLLKDLEREMIMKK
jgi:protein KRI1